MGMKTFRNIGRTAGLTAGALGLLALAGCGDIQAPSLASVDILGSQPSSSSGSGSAASGTTGKRVVGADGIVTYDSYQAAVAQKGDTVASVANRIGLSATELGAYNGLQADHKLRKGDELVLPPRPGGYGSGPAVASASQGAGQDTGQSGGQTSQYQSQYQSQAQSQAAAQGGSGGVTSMELAPLPGTAGTGGAGTGTTGATGSAPAQTTSKPGAGETWSPGLAAAAIDRSTGIDKNGKLHYPPSANEPLPPNPTEPGKLSSPDLSQYQTPDQASGQAAGQTLDQSGQSPAPSPRPAQGTAWQSAGGAQTATSGSTEAQPVPRAQQQQAMASPQPAQPAPQPAAPAQPATPSQGLHLIQPVQGVVVIGFRQGGRNGNDGIDYASPADSPVVAAAAGTVALVSQSLGGLGNIVLIRHPDNYLTVYGRLDAVTVKKGDIVRQGEQIGVVAGMTPPRMHFEVRRGAESLDPEQFFK